MQEKKSLITETNENMTKILYNKNKLIYLKTPEM